MNMNIRPAALTRIFVAVLCLAYHAGAAATNFTSVTYDATEDKLVVGIAYRGTHGDHQFSIEWGECRRLDDDRFQTYGLLIDSDPMDHARQEFSKKLEISLTGNSCRPAKITLRTATGFNRSIDIPAAKKNP
jgi:hypothetical protein